MPNSSVGETVTAFEPQEVLALRSEGSGDSSEPWESFLARYSRLLLHTAAKYSSEYDDKMERYLFIIEKLRADDYRRLKSYQPDVHCKFSTWLVVVAGRLCIDYHRAKHGRPRSSRKGAGTTLKKIGRDSLIELLSHDQYSEIPDDRPDPEDQLLMKTQMADLEKALLSLSPSDQLLISYRFRDGRTASEIARLMKLRSQFHVFRRLKNVLASVRASMDHKEGANDSE